MSILLFMHYQEALAQETNELPVDQDNTTASIPPVYLASKQGKLHKVRELIAMGTYVNTTNA
jgi:hypothetical protein